MPFQVCFLCDSKESRSYHRFPKDPSIRAEWMKFCSLNSKTDTDISSLLICSRHFPIESFAHRLISYQEGARRRLIKSAVPSLHNKPYGLLPCYVKDISVADAENDGISLQSVLPSSGADNLKRKHDETLGQSMRPSDEDSPNKQIKLREIRLQKQVTKQKLKIRRLQQKNRRLTKKISSLKELLNHLKSRNIISEDAHNNLLANVPDNLKSLIQSKLNNKRNRKYPPELRKFAVTLQFYSTRAYNYVRKTWSNLLPHTSTIKKWYSTVNGEPGFSSEALSAIKMKNQENDGPILLNIVMDEMSIRSQSIYQKNKFVGGVDLGTDFNEDCDNITEATHAFVFMAVCINSSWKVPLGYFFIKSLNASERANIFKKCLELVHETGSKVTSVTFDGASVNIGMCAKLGANFDVYGDFKPYIINPNTNEKILIFWDACHMIKLVRNTLGDKLVMFNKTNEKIKWSHIKQVHELQMKEGLHLANKLTKKHIDFSNNRMNVRLAVQTLSESVHNSLKYLIETKSEGFEDAVGTEEYCFMFNNMFDLLNCRNKFSKRNIFNKPIDEHSEEYLFENALIFIEYIKGLKDQFGTPILQTPRKTGFLGLIICLTNIFELYKKCKSYGMKYLLSFKVSQDPLEMFFSAVRNRGGFNDNPNVIQFKTAFKRLLIKNELKFFDGNSNCICDALDILGVSSSKKNDNIILEESDESDQTIFNLFDHDYMKTLWTLSPYIENIVEYISGYIVGKIKTKKICDICYDQLVGYTEPILIKLKNRGKLITPSVDLIKLCTVTEQIIRQNIEIITKKTNIKNYLTLLVLKETGQLFHSEQMINHIKSQDLLDNHRTQLIKLIVESFINVRMHYESKLKNHQKDEYIRQKYTKLVLFKNQ